MRLAVVIPCARPSMLAEVRANLERQTHYERLPILVLNGAAADCIPEVSGAVVLRSEAHPAAARNSALDWLEEHGGGAWVTMDDDDWYGAAYLAEFAEAFERGVQFVGKSRGTMALSDGTIVRNARGEWFTGGAMGSTDCSLRFPNLRLGEDHELHRLALERGLRVERLSERHYLYRRDRQGPRAWETDDVIALRSIPGDWDVLGSDPWATTEERPRVFGVRQQPTADEIFAAMESMEWQL